MTNILLTADQYYPPTLGGSAISVRRLAHGLAGRGHRVTVLAPSPSFKDYTEYEDRVRVVRCRSIAAWHLLKHADRHRIRVALLPMGTVKRTLEEVKPEVIHLQLPAYIGAVALHLGRKRGIATVGTLHALPDNPFPTRNKRSAVYRLFASKFWENIVSQGTRCDVVTAPSQTACNLIKERGFPGTAIPISNGVDLDRFRPASNETERRAIRARLGLPEDRALILYAGRFAREKRLDVLLKAVPAICRATEAHFVMVGTGSVEVKELAERLGVSAHVTFTGLLDDEDLPLVYRGVDVFVLPSEAELQGMVLLEAAASGLPLVGANIFAIPEVVHDGENGFLHEPGDENQLAERLIKLVQDPLLRERFSTASYRLAQEHSFERTLDAFEGIYATAMAAELAATSGGSAGGG